MSESVLRAAQGLDTDPLVELWELDTSSLANMYGEVGEGRVYRWTPGVLNYRETGNLTWGTTTALALDRAAGINNSALNYTVQVAGTADPDHFSAPIRINGWGSATVDGVVVSVLNLASPLPEVPAPNARWLVESVGTVFFGGVEYRPAPIELTGMEWSGQGKLPRPTLRVNNIGGLAGALVIRFGDIVGATVTRFTTFKSFLDGEATPDGSATFEPDVFTVDRKSAHNKSVIEFELAAAFDQQGIRLPKRLVMRDYCDHTYRQWTLTAGGYGHFVYGTCPFAFEGFWFKPDGTAATRPQDDVCGHKISDCILRFGSNARLPFRGFPGVAEVRV